MIVRRVEIDDYKEMMELLKEFGEEYGGPAVVEELSLERVFMRALHTGVGFVALNDGKIIGGIGGVYMPNPYNELLSMLTELYWYVRPEFRGTNASSPPIRREEAAAILYTSFLSVYIHASSIHYPNYHHCCPTMSSPCHAQYGIRPSHIPKTTDRLHSFHEILASHTSTCLLYTSPSPRD